MSSFFRDRFHYTQSHTLARRKIAERSNIRYLLVASLAAAAFCVGASPAWISADKKVRRIEADRWPPGRSISFTAQELLAIGVENANSAFPGVLHNPELQLAEGGATGTATVDFDRLRQLSAAKDSTRDWFMSKLLTGQHPVSVTVGTTSSKGQMTVHPKSVSVSGVTVSGSTLQFLMQNFVQSHYPDAIIDRPFRLAQNIDRIDVKPGLAIVIAK